MEKMAGRFPVQHVDLQFNNLLLDDDFNITGLLDWSGASLIRNMVQRAWKKRESGRGSPKSAMVRAPEFWWSLTRDLV
jgi:hypothetical protein